MAKTAKKVIDKAISFIGVKENPAGSNKVQFNKDYYGKDVSGSAYPWCCAYVWDVYRLAGCSSLFYDGQKTAYCPTVEGWAKQKGLVVDKTKGQYGDIVLFDFNNSGKAGHIGFIEKKNSDGTYTCIEGNTSVTSNDNGGSVMRRTRALSLIRCVIRPKYDKDTSTTTTTTKSTSNKPKSTVDSKSSVSDVKWLQTKLNACLNSTYKAKLGNKKLTVDGKFGAQTSVAISYYWKQLGWKASSPGTDGYYHAGTKTINALDEGKTK